MPDLARLRAKRLFLLDLDGTLLYTLADIATAVNGALREMHRPERTVTEIRSMVGNGAKMLITRALGPEEHIECDVYDVTLGADERLLLCSDGLTNMVPVEQMEQLLAQGPFYDLPDRLVDAANENGGSDNITALLLAVEPTEVHHG